MADKREGFADAIDRDKVCPLLLRCFWKVGAHHRVEDFAEANQGIVPMDEVQIYTWADASLRELTDLIKEVNPAARRRTARLNFAFVYPDKRGRNVLKEVGIVYSNRRSDADDKTLRALRFQTGDFLDVAIFT
uniref:Histone deacetylase complex subunit SAP18 n=1 Tax=Fibrocapsa japonica TaxID=94617 RepID=A0A7S2XY13_9STRA|eukprot:CAMPEP_0113939184 /NCGR_PEP_ID=MMETSP1339-20121228/5542_1 /TAXON_ID=94617 /ORGANISM="Fibrocapsa japonica" /LENGTH=132 /DNA_ID=CAMNT_0000942609 /DNA_START=58 /DNA_END=456 /DNA_ORIENTATION=- /assembly_acc=CAM_ASM_000762